MSSDLKKKCRTCMGVGNSHYQLQNYIVEDYRVMEMLDSVVPQIQVKAESPFANLICHLCVDKLLTGYKFQLLCIETDNHFRRLMGLPLLEEDDIKPDTICDPLMEEELLSVEEALKRDNDLEMEAVGEADGSDTDSSNENLKVLKVKKLRTSLKTGNHINSATEKTYRAHHKERHKGGGKDLQSSDNLPSENLKEHSSQVVIEKIQDSTQIFEEPVEDIDDNNEWLCSEEDSIDLETYHSPKKSASKPEHGKNIDFVDTGIGEIEKPNTKNRRNGNYPCDVCGKIFDRPFRLKRHSSVHSLSKPYACEICKCRFSTASYLKTHKMLHQNKSTEDFQASQDLEGFKCPDCPRRFEKQSSLSAHRQIHTRNAFTASYSCSVLNCQRTFMSVKTLTEHVTTKHPDAERYTCDQCDKSFVIHAHLLEHLNRHKGNKNLVCVICEKEFGFMSTLKEHMRIHSGESPYLCPECGKTFRNGSNLRQHTERHSGLKKYQCPECPSRFNCRSDLKKHIDTHNSIRSFECDICGSRFTRSYSLQKHKRLHLGKRPYRCDHDQCNMSFALLYHLRRHKRTHTGEKPFKCKYCERAYGERGDLNKHLRTHLGENTYMCDQCPKAFKYQLELRQHQSEHYKISQQKADCST